jgi:hypothetical protein
MDGVNGVTECPIAPGQTKTYRFQATQHGTSVSFAEMHFTGRFILTIIVVPFTLRCPVRRGYLGCHNHQRPCHGKLRY